MPGFLRRHMTAKTGIKRGFKKGFTLMEVVMATLISAMTATAVYSVVLSSFVSQGKADTREAAALVLKRAQSVLNSYVAVEDSNSLYSLPGSTPGRWSADSSGGWALAGGNHDISSLLVNYPAIPSGGRLTYQVTNIDCGMGISDRLACKRVLFTLSYPEQIR